MSSSSPTAECKELLEPDIEEVKEEINGDDEVLSDDDKAVDDNPVDGDKPIDDKPEDNKPEDNKPEDNKPEDNKPEDNKPEDNKPEDNTKSDDSEDDGPLWNRGKPKRSKYPKPRKYEVQDLVVRELPKRVTSKINYAEVNSDVDEDEDSFYDSKPKKQKKDTSSEEDESWNEDSDDSVRKDTKVQKKQLEEEVEEEEEEEEDNENGSDKKLSDYQKLLEKNRAEKMAFLQSLKVNEAKEDLQQVMDSFKRKRKYVRKEKSEQPPPAMRKSSRLDNKTFDYSEDALYVKAMQDATADIQQAINPVMSFEEALIPEVPYKSFLKDVKVQESKVECEPLYYTPLILKKLKLSESTYSRFKAEYNVRLTTLAWHPSESLILAGGCSQGNLSLQNIGKKSCQYLFEAHTKKITKVDFNPFNPTRLVTSSYDGTLRSGDIVKQVFNEVYKVSGKTSLYSFDFLSESAYVAAQGNGDIGLIDIRTKGKRYEKLHKCHETMVYDVQVHPVNKDYFLTTNKTIRIWDLRMLSKGPLADVKSLDKGSQKAYFSPITGKYILSTSKETIRIYDSSNLTTGIKLKKQKKLDKKFHKPSSGATYRACWMPNSEREVFIGSTGTPRGLQVCDTDMNVKNLISHKDFLSFTAVNVFHPYRPGLAVGRHLHRGMYIFT